MGDFISGVFVFLMAVVCPIIWAYGFITDMIHHHAAWAAVGFAIPPVGLARGIMYLVG